MFLIPLKHRNLHPVIPHLLEFLKKRKLLRSHMPGPQQQIHSIFHRLFRSFYLFEMFLNLCLPGSTTRNAPSNRSSVYSLSTRCSSSCIASCVLGRTRRKITPAPIPATNTSPPKSLSRVMK